MTKHPAHQAHPSGTIRYQWVPVYQVPVYQVYQEDQDQISGATYISDVVFKSSLVLNLTVFKTIQGSCDIWDTDYNSYNWESEFMTISVTWQSRVTVDSIHNSCCKLYHQHYVSNRHKNFDYLFSSTRAPLSCTSFQNLNLSRWTKHLASCNC